MQMSKLPITGLIILGVLALFLVQNSSPMLTVTFLGITSIALPLGIWLLIPFLAGIVSSGFVALLLPRGDRTSGPASTSGTMKSARTPQPSPRRLRDDAFDETDLDETGFEPGAEESPGKTLAPDEKRRTSSAAAQRRPSRRNDVSPSRVGESESEVWDDEDWPDDEEWSDDAEGNPSGVAVGHYEVHKEPVSAYRQGTLYSYSYSKSALEEVSEPETSESETSELEVSESEISESNISESEISEPKTSESNISELEVSEPQSVESQRQDSPPNADRVEGLNPSDEESHEGKGVIGTSESRTGSETTDEPDEILEGEFLDELEDHELEDHESDPKESQTQKSGFFRSKLFGFQDKAPREDDWSDPPPPPKDW
ncbi:MAG: hypothetical protein ACQERW_03615 [Cyanobacteriota bacterium]